MAALLRPLPWRAAPDHFLETASETWEDRGSFRNHLYFDLSQSDTTKPFEAKDVIIAGNEIELYFSHSAPPEVSWTPYSVPLRADGNWMQAGTDEPATPEQLETVLTHLDKLWIRGEFRTGEDVGGIDNIMIR